MLVTNGSIVWDCLRVAIPQKQCVATKGLRVACLGTCIHGGVKIHHCRGQTSLSHLSPETRLGSLRSSCHVRDESSDVTIHGFQWIYICKIIIMPHAPRESNSLLSKMAWKNHRLSLPIAFSWIPHCNKSPKSVMFPISLQLNHYLMS